MKLKLKFSEPKTIGDGRTVSSSPLPENADDFWAFWRAEKQAIKAAGYSVGKFKDEWQISKWNDKKIDASIIADSQAITAPAGFDVPVPDGLRYFPYQLAGIKFLAEHESVLLADPMGLGKTIQILGLLNLERPKTVLIVCKSSLKINWLRETEKWLAEPRCIAVVNGGKTPFPADPDIVIINYDVLNKHKSALLSRTWGCVVFDESHFLKNNRAARTKVALKIKAKRRYALTGTPIPNRPIEIQPVAGYLDQKEFGNFMGFAKRYANAHKNNFGWDFDGSSNLDELRERLRSTIMLRREKSAVLPDLPAKRRQVIVLPSDGYDDVLADEASFATMGDALLEISKGDRVRFEEISRVRHATALAKVPAVVDHLLAIDEPVVVFAHHHDVVEAIEKGLEDSRSVVTLHGGHSQDHRQAAVDDFQSGKADVFIGTIGAAGVGLTLIRASICVFAELDWVSGSLNQAEDRLCRIGQRDSVLCQHIVIDHSLDARVIELVVGKQSISDTVLDTYVQPSPEAVSQPQTVSRTPTIEELAAAFNVEAKDEVREIDLRQIPSGRYAVPGGDTRLKVYIRHVDDGKYSGWSFVTDCAIYGDQNRYGNQRPGGLYRGQIGEALQTIVEDHVAAAAAYGRLVGTCGFCNTHLENEESIERGIGPVCYAKYCS